MKAGYEIQKDRLAPCGSSNPPILVYAQPTDAEKEEVLQTLSFDRLTLESILDPDEISRVEVFPDGVLIIWKQPNKVSYEQKLKFEVSSLGVMLEPSKVTVILAEEAVPFRDKEFQRVRSVVDLTLKLLLSTIRHYLGHLKAIKLTSQDLESKVSTSMENKYLLQMFNLGESLVYYYNALEANAAVLDKLRSVAERIGFSKEDIDLLDDLAIENRQACKQANIYSTVLSGLMDARGTIVNNNMNVLLKNLTLINVVFLPLNLIASIGGMSEFSMMTGGFDWRIAYGVFFLGIVLLGWLTWVWLIRALNRGQDRAARNR